jgi:hypothetical protein
LSWQVVCLTIADHFFLRKEEFVFENGSDFSPVLAGLYE